MVKAWMPGAERLDGGVSRTAPGTGAPRAVWTVTGSGPGARSAREEARRLLDEGRTAHLVWNPLTGGVAQVLPATRRGRLEPGRPPQRGRYPDRGLEGRVCLLVAVAAAREAPFTDGPMRGLVPILEWLDSWGVERIWPAGPPGADRVDAARTWARGGHFGHDQVPGSTSEGPGRLDTARLLAGGPHEGQTPQKLRTRTGPRPSATK